jgi:transposase InsO family protein
VPAHLRSDHGPEFIATVVGERAAAVGVTLVRTAQGCPWHNPFIESFNSRAREGFTAGVVFGSLEEARVRCETFRRWDNVARRHSSPGRQAPAAFAAGVRSSGLILDHPGLVKSATA